VEAKMVILTMISHSRKVSYRADLPGKSEKIEVCGLWLGSLAKAKPDH